MEDALLPPEQEVARSNRAGRTIPFNHLRCSHRRRVGSLISCTRFAGNRKDRLSNCVRSSSQERVLPTENGRKVDARARDRRPRLWRKLVGVEPTLAAEQQTSDLKSEPGTGQV